MRGAATATPRSVDLVRRVEDQAGTTLWRLGAQRQNCHGRTSGQNGVEPFPGCATKARLGITHLSRHSIRTPPIVCLVNLLFVADVPPCKPFRLLVWETAHFGGGGVAIFVCTTTTGPAASPKARRTSLAMQFRSRIRPDPCQGHHQVCQRERLDRGPGLAGAKMGKRNRSKGGGPFTHPLPLPQMEEGLGGKGRGEELNGVQCTLLMLASSLNYFAGLFAALQIANRRGGGSGQLANLRIPLAHSHTLGAQDLDEDGSQISIITRGKGVKAALGWKAAEEASWRSQSEGRPKDGFNAPPSSPSGRPIQARNIRLHPARGAPCSVTNTGWLHLGEGAMLPYSRASSCFFLRI